LRQARSLSSTSQHGRSPGELRQGARSLPSRRMSLPERFLCILEIGRYAVRTESYNFRPPFDVPWRIRGGGLLQSALRRQALARKPIRARSHPTSWSGGPGHRRQWLLFKATCICAQSMRHALSTWPVQMEHTCLAHSSRKSSSWFYFPWSTSRPVREGYSVVRSWRRVD
jgi:hypothetical protein